MGRREEDGKARGGWEGAVRVVVTNRAETAERHYLVTYMIFMRKKWLFRKNCINFIAGKVTMRE